MSVGAFIEQPFSSGKRVIWAMFHDKDTRFADNAFLFDEFWEFFQPRQIVWGISKNDVPCFAGLSQPLEYICFNRNDLSDTKTQCCCPYERT